MKTFLVFDLIATVVGSVVFFATKDMLAASYFRLARLVRVREIGSSVFFVFTTFCCRKTSTQRGIVYKRLIQWGITFLVSVHFIACFWIWIGAIDAYEEEP